MVLFVILSDGECGSARVDLYRILSCDFHGETENNLGGSRDRKAETLGMFQKEKETTHILHVAFGTDKEKQAILCLLLNWVTLFF